jgi:hypothetical protein
MLGAGMFLRYLLEKVQLVLHRRHDQVVLPFLVVLRLLLPRIARALRGLRSFVNFLIVVLGFPALLLLDKLAPLDIPGEERFAGVAVFAPDDGEFEVVAPVALCILGPLTGGRGGEALLLSTLMKRKEEGCLKKLTGLRWRVVSYYKPFPW